MEDMTKPDLWKGQQRIPLYIRLHI